MRKLFRDHGLDEMYEDFTEKGQKVIGPWLIADALYEVANAIHQLKQGDNYNDLIAANIEKVAEAIGTLPQG